MNTIKKGKIIKCKTCGKEKYYQQYIFKKGYGKYCSHKCYSETLKKKEKKTRYVFARCDGHPKANSWGYVYKHILVIEKMIGRYLKKGERVHHRDKDAHNNRLSNLRLCCSESEHKLIHSGKII